MLSVMALWVPIWLSSSVLWSERQESYAFLRTLPVTDREIVRTKFSLALGSALLYWLFLALLIRRAWGSTPEYAGYMALASLTCAIAIILSAAWYIFSWRFGIPALTVCVIVFLVIVIITTMAANIERMIHTGGIGILAPRWLAEGPWFYHILLLAAALAAYYGLMQVAVRVKVKREV
jgi:glucan phosphoethanolaminetransferase (alkaline phosphatase superfamily)